MVFNNSRQNVGLTQGVMNGRVFKLSVVTALYKVSQNGCNCVRENWRRFLEGCWSVLGPAQRQHVTAHCQAVALLGSHMATKAGLSNEMVDRLHTAGLLHDIGKCFISDELLSKPGRLSDEEWQIMNRHSAAGGWLCKKLGADIATVQMVLDHHNPYNTRFQDNSRKRSIKGVDLTELETATRILTVADAFVTMCSQRSYCSAMSLEEALCELKRCEGLQFDPGVVQLVQNIYRKAA